METKYAELTEEKLIKEGVKVQPPNALLPETPEKGKGKNGRGKRGKQKKKKQKWTGFPQVVLSSEEFKTFNKRVTSLLGKCMIDFYKDNAREGIFADLILTDPPWNILLDTAGQVVKEDVVPHLAACPVLFCCVRFRVHLYLFIYPAL